MAYSPKTSARRFERIAKKIVREDVELQSTDEPFFIDKEVYNLHLAEMREIIEDSSLSDFLLKYDLTIHTTELIKYFGPQSSTKRDFVNLKYLSGRYGYHLCYMALRESASDDNENEDLVRSMKSTAITRKKKPPSDLYTDSLTHPSIISSSTTNNDSSGEDELSGQGELGNIEQRLANLKMEGHNDPIELPKYLKKAQDRTRQRNVSSHKQFAPQHIPLCTCPTCTVETSGSSSPDPTESEQTDHDRARQRNISSHKQFAPQHIPSCSCSMCTVAVSGSSNSSSPESPTEKTELTDNAENKIDSNTGTLTVRQFSAPHMGSCSCVMCMSVKRDIEKEESAESNNISKCVPLNAVRERRSIGGYRQLSAPHLGECTCTMCIKYKMIMPDSGNTKKNHSFSQFGIQESGEDGATEKYRIVEFGSKIPLSNVTSYDYSNFYPREKPMNNFNGESEKLLKPRNIKSRSHENLSIVNEEGEEGGQSRKSDDDNYSRFEQESSDGKGCSVLAAMPSSLRSNVDSGKPTSIDYSSLIATANNKSAEVD